MDLGPSDMPCREEYAPNYVTYTTRRGELSLVHFWFYRTAGETAARWHQCDPRLCRECQRNAMACTPAAPMA